MFSLILFVIGVGSAFYLGRWFQFWWPREKSWKEFISGKLNRKFKTLDELTKNDPS